MRRMIAVISLCLCMVFFCGCEQLPEQISPETILKQLETLASSIDVEAVVTDVVERIDWEELKTMAKEGYDTLTDHYPALESENIRSYLKENGLSLLNTLVGSTDAETQDNARKLGEILKILNPELTDEVNSVIKN